MAVKPLLHDANEELDLQTFRTYVRSLPIDDLSDIRLHLDEYQFPARYDVLRREMERRRRESSAVIRSAKQPPPKG